MASSSFGSYSGATQYRTSKSPQAAMSAAGSTSMSRSGGSLTGFRLPEKLRSNPSQIQAKIKSRRKINLGRIRAFLGRGRA